MSQVDNRREAAESDQGMGSEKRATVTLGSPPAPPPVVVQPAPAPVPIPVGFGNIHQSNPPLEQLPNLQFCLHSNPSWRELRSSSLLLLFFSCCENYVYLLTVRCQGGFKKPFFLKKKIKIVLLAIILVD